MCRCGAHGGQEYDLRYAMHRPRQTLMATAASRFTGLMLRGEQCVTTATRTEEGLPYVGDIARANIAALTKGNGLVANIGTGQGITVNHIYEVLSKATANEIEARYGPARPGDVRNFWLDYSRAKAALGWEPLVSFEDGVRLTVESLRS